MLNTNSSSIDMNKLLILELLSKNSLRSWVQYRFDSTTRLKPTTQQQLWPISDGCTFQ